MTEAVFTTERLVVRPWTHEDAPRHRDIYSRMDVVKWLGGQPPRPIESLEQSEQSIERWASRASNDGRFAIWAVEIADTGLIAGTVLLVPMALTGEEQARLPEDGGDVEVGWHLHPDCWGNGFAAESARAAVEKGFAEGLDEVIAVVLPGNKPSVAVTQRLGMQPTGRTSKWYGLEMDSFSLRRA